jgi:hypothetical protein
MESYKTRYPQINFYSVYTMNYIQNYFNVNMPEYPLEYPQKERMQGDFIGLLEIG